MPRYVFTPVSLCAHKPVPPGVHVVEPAKTDDRDPDALYPGDVVETAHELDPDVDGGLWRPVKGGEPGQVGTPAGRPESPPPAAPPKPQPESSPTPPPAAAKEA